MGRKRDVEDEVFDAWNVVKKRLDKYGAQKLYFKEGQIWWCALGKNVGVETYGKNEKFSRPVLILKKLSSRSFLGVPLTSQEHHGSWFVDFFFKGKHEFANLAQIRVLSVGRMYEKMGEISKGDLLKVKEGFSTLYCQ